MKYITVEFRPGEQPYTFRCADDKVQEGDMVVVPVVFPRAKSEHLSIGIVLAVEDVNMTAFADDRLRLALGIVDTFAHDEYQREQVRQSKLQAQWSATAIWRAANSEN